MNLTSGQRPQRALDLQEENLESYEQENLLKIGNEFWQGPAREYLPEN